MNPELMHVIFQGKDHPHINYGQTGVIEENFYTDLLTCNTFQHNEIDFWPDGQRRAIKIKIKDVYIGH